MSNLYNSILITGAAGFIGSALSLRLLEEKYNIIGIDNMNNYYSIKLKKDRVERINKNLENLQGSWVFQKCSIDSKEDLNQIFKKYSPDLVVNLAAQAGVRYSLKNPNLYIESNIKGFLNILECCKEYKVKRLIYASSSSVYGSNKKIPFSESDTACHPISLYASTKRSNELMAHSYSHLYNIDSIGLRFFTVYGPWGRPDMAPMIFAKSILKGEYIDIYNNGEMSRDFTFIDDVVEIILKCIQKNNSLKSKFDFDISDPSESFAPHKIFNIGNGKPIKLMDFISHLEKNLEISAKKNFMELQDGDVISTHADISKIQNWIGNHQMTSFEKGINKFVQWYKNYYYPNY